MEVKGEKINEKAVNVFWNNFTITFHNALEVNQRSMENCR